MPASGAMILYDMPMEGGAVPSDAGPIYPQWFGR